MDDDIIEPCEPIPCPEIEEYQIGGFSVVCPECGYPTCFRATMALARDDLYVHLLEHWERD